MPDYDGQGTKEFPYCPAGTDAKVTCGNTNRISNSSGTTLRDLRCVRKENVVCPNGYAAWGPEQNCVLVQPTHLNSIGNNTVCKYDESGWNIGCVPGDNPSAYISNGWKLNKCTSHVEVSGPIFCKALFERTGPDPTKGEYYYPDDSSANAPVTAVTAVSSQFNPSEAIKCNSDTCNDAVQSILFNDLTMQWEPDPT